MLTKVYHINLYCSGKGASNKKPKAVGVFRAHGVDEEFEIMCPHCCNMVKVYYKCLACPSKYPEYDGLRYQDVTNQFQGK